MFCFEKAKVCFMVEAMAKLVVMFKVSHSTMEQLILKLKAIKLVLHH